MVNQFIELIKNFFLENLKDFKLEHEVIHGPYWSVSYVLNETKVIISGDIGFEVIVELFETKYELWQYDKRVNNTMESTEKNILFQLNVLKSFLNDNL